MHDTSEGGTGQPTTGYGGLSVPLGVHFAELRSTDDRWLMRLKYAESLLDVERDRRYEERFKAQEKAIQVAESNNQAWRASTNEWRKTVEDLIKRNPTREELAAERHRIDTLEAKRERDEGGQEQKQDRRSVMQPFQVALLGVIGTGIIGVIVAIFLR